MPNQTAVPPAHETWDLTTIFDGGSDGPALTGHLKKAAADLAALREAVERTTVPQTAAEAEAWSRLLQQAWDLDARLTEAGAFVYCLMAEDTADEAAQRRYDEISELEAELAGVTALLAGQLLALDDAVWEALIGLPELAPAAFYLAEQRAEAAAKLPPAAEELIESLSIDGLHAWESLRDGIVGRMRIEVPTGEAPVGAGADSGRATVGAAAAPATESLSPGQMTNRLQTPDRIERQRLWRLWEQAWAEQADLLADVLNRIVGFRLNVYRQRGWDDVLYEALQNNRMARQTLEAMWAGVASAAPALHRYLARKAELLGVPGLAWHDLAVPYSPGQPQPIGYAEGCRLIVDEFNRIDRSLAAFAQMAVQKRWIEAEDRPGKMAGAFAPDFPQSRQARIFMTYGGTVDSVTTLAHELGHAYHYWVMRDLPRPAQIYSSNVAETASTYAEWIVSDAALRRATSQATRLHLLSHQCETAVLYLLNVRTRFLFEQRLCAERQRGPLSVARLNELMVSAQRDAYGPVLHEPFPHLWASTMHFYVTGQPFYNFHYTFGYLFSTGLYAQAKAAATAQPPGQGPDFPARYAALLRDTGRMTIEDLAEQHLGVDLRQPEFWQHAAAAATAPIETFLKESDPSGSTRIA